MESSKMLWSVLTMTTVAGLVDTLRDAVSGIALVPSHGPNSDRVRYMADLGWRDYLHLCQVYLEIGNYF